MTVLQNVFTGGTNGSAINPANSGGASGDAFQDVIASAGTVVFSNAQTIHGSLSAAITGTAQGTSYMQWTSAQIPTPSTTFRTRQFGYFTGNPSSELGVVWVGNGSARAIAVNIDTSGKILVRNAAASGGAVVAPFTNAIPLNSWWRLETRIVQSATAGEIHIALYAGDSTTPLESKDLTGQNTGSNLINTVRFGRHSSQPYSGTYYLGAIQADDSAATSYIGPPASTPPTVVVAGADTYRIDASQSVGGSKTYSIAQTDGPTAVPESVGAGKWDVARSPDGARVYDVTVTDGAGASTLSVTVPQKTTSTGTGGGVREKVRVNGQWG